MQFTHCSDEYKDGGTGGTEKGDSVLKDSSIWFERKQNERKKQRKEMWESKEKQKKALWQKFLQDAVIASGSHKYWNM